jgi:ABC-2 type transport system permease protein
MNQIDLAPTTAPSSPDAGAGLGRLLRLSLVRARLELLGLVRSKDAVIFTLALPVMLLLLFGILFSDTLEGSTVTVGQWFTPGVIASSVLSAGFVNLATSMAIERHDGTLRRLALTPLPAASYLIGKIAMTFVLAVGMTVALLALGVAAFGVDLPTGAGDLVPFAWVFLLGVAAAAVLGIALASLPRSAKSAAVVFTPPFLFLQFVSGVFIEFNSVPPWMRAFAGVFPLRWLAAGMRSVFLPDQFEAAVEPGGSYQLGVGAIVLSLWVVAGLIVAARTFRFGRE